VVLFLKKNGEEKLGVNFPLSLFQDLIDNVGIVPGWHTLMTFLQSLASHVSVVEYTCPCPGALKDALHPASPDLSIRLDSFMEEHLGLMAEHTFDVLSKEEYFHFVSTMGKKVIPSKCVRTVKKDSLGNLVGAKSQIVVFGNKDPTNLSKAGCYAPVMAQLMI